MRRHKNVFQSKEQDKSPEKNRNEMEVNSLPNKEFKVMVIKMIPDLRRRMGEHGKSSNKEVENRGRSWNWTEEYIRGFSNSIDEIVAWISELKEKVMENTQAEREKNQKHKNPSREREKKKKELKEMRIS